MSGAPSRGRPSGPLIATENDAAAAFVSGGHDVVWSAAGPDESSTVAVRRLQGGIWHVTNVGVSWATNGSLRAALSDACGVEQGEAWTLATEREVLRLVM